LHTADKRGGEKLGEKKKKRRRGKKKKEKGRVPPAEPNFSTLTSKCFRKRESNKGKEREKKKKKGEGTLSKEPNVTFPSLCTKKHGEKERRGTQYGREDQVQLFTLSLISAEVSEEGEENRQKKREA